MSQFDDLNEALAALKSEMRAATTATQAVARLGQAADVMGQHASAVESRLKSCESRIGSLDQSITAVIQSIERLSEKTASHWKEAINSVVAGSGTEYVEAVKQQLINSEQALSVVIETLRAEYSQREVALKRARKWLWILSLILTAIVIGGGVSVSYWFFN